MLFCNIFFVKYYLSISRKSSILSSAIKKNVQNFQLIWLKCLNFVLNYSKQNVSIISNEIVCRMDGSKTYDPSSSFFGASGGVGGIRIRVQ